MAEGGGDFVASRALHTLEVGIGALHQILLLVFPLLFWEGMKEILSKRQVVTGKLSLLESKTYFL